MTFDYTPIVKGEDGSYTGSFLITSTLPDITSITVTKIACCDYERYYYGDNQYEEEELADFTVTKNDAGDGLIVSFNVPAELAAAYATGNGTSAEPTGYTGFDLYYDMEFDGDVTTGLYESVTDAFEVEAAEAPAEAEEAPAEAEEAPAEAEEASAAE